MLNQTYCLLNEKPSEEIFFADEDNSDEELFFADEVVEETATESWKVLIVDDEIQVHAATDIALRKFVFQDKPLTFINAYSAKEAKELIQAHPDVAIVLLDVIMETDDAGLEVVKYIREDLGNQLVRIILRTGQPGQVPEKSVIINYDINDYKTKTELTAQKLFTTVLTALRSFSLGQKLQSEIERREQVEVALRCSEEKEREKAIALENSLNQLQQAQLQLVQSEKMSSLGQLVAGVAHEINNPVNFIYGNLSHSHQYIQEIIELLQLYQLHYPQPVPEILDRIEDIDLPFIMTDLPKMLSSMQVGADRICNIVTSLRKFSRVDETELKAVNIHEGIDSTLMILQHRLKAKSFRVGNTEYHRPTIEVIKEYGSLPLVTCYAGQLNQVFMNLLANAIDALEEQTSRQDTATYHPQIHIHTKITGSDSADGNSFSPRISISIADNGSGMTENVRSKIFNCLFTTKDLDKGTGMGLSISRQIIVEKHRGELQCISTPGQGTKFMIEIPLMLAETKKIDATNC